MAEVGQKVAVHYRGTLDDGTVFADTRREGGPVEFVVGSRTMLPGFELAVARMVPGEACDVCIPCTEAYGAYDGSLVVSVPRSALPASARLSEGERFRVRAGGEVASVKLVSREGDFLVIDCNHELAGEDLHFHIEYVGLASESAIERELHAGCSCGCRKLKEQLGA